MKKIYVLIAALCLATGISAQKHSTVYVAPDGNDANPGSKDKPFATFRKAHESINGGDTVYFRSGTYKFTDADIMKTEKQYAYVSYLDKAGKAKGRTCYMGFPGERPVFDFSGVVAEGHRISAIALMADYIHLKNFDIVGVPVRIKGHTQSECVSGRGGSHCLVENLAMHDGMAIGYYQIKGCDNFVLNCDAYNNYDPYSEGPYGGNVDGFGFHLVSPEFTGNHIKGCRAWRNSDDGYDLINCFSAVTIEDCYAFFNGYQATADAFDLTTFNNAGDGNGFKSGGFSMKPAGEKPIPLIIPVHTIRHCVSYKNKVVGFNSNHHLGGNVWEDNIAMANPTNYVMRNRHSEQENRDIPGYGHSLIRNISFVPGKGGHLSMLDDARSICIDNSFAPVNIDITEDMFKSIDPKTLFAPRLDDGTLPEIPFLSPVYPIVGNKEKHAILNVIGDSYVANHRRPKQEAWHYKMAMQLGMAYNGYGRNGSCIAFDRTHDGKFNFGPALWIRYKAMTPDADYVLIIAGHNDADKVKNNKDSLRMFTDSLNIMLDGIKLRCPNAKIAFVTPWYVDRPGFKQVIAEIEKACRKRNIPVLMNYSKDCIVKVRDAEFRKKYFQDANDTAHLNAAGHDLFLEVAMEWFKKYVLDSNNSQLPTKHI